jgi:dTMP kinase
MRRTVTGRARIVKEPAGRIRAVAFITFEGIEGSGKSTQLLRLAARLGERAVATREPGGTAIGRGVRDVLLDPANRVMAPMAELLLYFADRAQNLAEVIRPGLAEGRVVLCDRHVESSLAYQGYGRGLPLDAIRELAALATGGLRPDLIVLIDVPVEVGLARVGRRGEQDRLEREVLAFHERVRAGFAALLAEEPSRWLQLDGTQPEDAVFAALCRGLAARGVRGTEP